MLNADIPFKHQYFGLHSREYGLNFLSEKHTGNDAHMNALVHESNSIYMHYPAFCHCHIIGRIMHYLGLPGATITGVFYAVRLYLGRYACIYAHAVFMSPKAKTAFYW